MNPARVIPPLLAAILLSIVLPAGAARKGAREIDLLWTHPGIASAHLESVAMLPAASYDNVSLAERHAENELMRSIRDAGYRWISALTTREMLRRGPSGDSLLKGLRQSLLDLGRVDSLAAPRLCALLRVDGLIAVRVERAEQVHIQSDQSGKPSSTIFVRATLVDSLGRLLWSASGTQTSEGPYLQAAPTGSGTSNLQLGQSATQTRLNAPDWPVPLELLFARWKPSFPVRGVPAPGAEARPDSAAR